MDKHSVAMIYESEHPLKWDILSVKHSRLIEDPFPELTEEERLVNIENSMSPFFQTKKKEVDKSKYPSPWTAYRMGYEKAYEEILAAIGHKNVR